MTKEKVMTVTRYVEELTNKLNAPVPDKHKDREDTYKSFLRREISKAKAKLDDARMEPAHTKASVPSK